MEVPPIARTVPSSSPASGQSALGENEDLRNAITASRKLNGLDIADREFEVKRDPTSHRFIVVVLERSTGTVLDQFPPENILNMLAQLSPEYSKQTGDAPQ
jgi:uncharacterized FlaG/YvyC family protein